MGTAKELLSYTQNRELSWLKFNERVLEEAQDKSVPILERQKFISIFSNNLDEFFMVRVGSLLDLSIEHNSAIDNKSGLSPSGQLEKVYEAVRPLYAKRDEVYAEVEAELRQHGIGSLDMAELAPDDRKYVKNYFKLEVLPVMSPQIVGPRHPFPHLSTKTIHVAAMLRRKNSAMIGIAAMPDTVPGVIFIPGDDIRYVTLDKVVLEYVDTLFEMYEIADKNILCVTRNADIDYEEEGSEEIEGDFRFIMKKLLKKRRRLSAVRLEMMNQPSAEFEKILCDRLQVGKRELFVTKTPMKFSYLSLANSKLPAHVKQSMSYPPFTPHVSVDIPKKESIMKQMRKQDLLLMYPFESMEPFLKLVKEAAHDPAVVSIKISIYRVAQKARLIEYLCAAAENGKDVTVLIELRARFDEQNNINWSERLEEAGCRLIFGFDGVKVHAKLCLITRKDRGEIQYITQVGTGNFNEITAEFYTDLSLITADPKIGAETNRFFRNMAIANLSDNYDLLLVAPSNLKSTVLALIDEQIALGAEGRIVLKLNSLTDIDVIKKLSEASCAGVKTDLIIRGICCIVPGIPGATENITVTSVVGRYLEHSRVYSFGAGAEQKMYISSADMMTRNTMKRVEIAGPILDEQAKARINGMIDLVLRDNVKARRLRSDGYYEKIPHGSGEPVDSQETLMRKAWECIEHAKQQEKTVAVEKKINKDGVMKASVKGWLIRMIDRI
ncbi:MAG: polyphosphate kinase 1 [Chitinispirillia bacterium]|nr:polyphosphate kinase 1 [Chitinispirillia bacterium]MCL2242140.1 polyphosphate kinase 1 [Chitinispirillia bacterium]